MTKNTSRRSFGIASTFALWAATGSLLPSVALAQEAPSKGPEVWTYLAALPKEERLAVMEREASREGDFTLYASLGIDRAQILIGIFNERYPNIKVNFVRLTESDVVDKVLLEARTGSVNSDLALSTVAWLELLAPALAPFEPTEWGDYDSRFTYGSEKDGWTGIVYEMLPVTIAWRTDRVTAAEAPKNLVEVTDPKWSGRIGGTTHLENMMSGLIGLLGEEQAMELLNRLAANKPRLYGSTAALAQGIAAGEIDVAYDFSAPRPVGLKAKGAPIDYRFQDPLFGIGITFSIVKDAPHPYAAALFMDYLTQAAPQEALDKAEGGRFFGNLKGDFSNKLADHSSLIAYQPIPPERFKELNRIAQEMFVLR